MLRIDGHTATNARGRFAQLCVQVSLDKPLVKNILIGKFRQPITYEGIHSLCFSCGRLGHRKDTCLQTIRKHPKLASQEQGTFSNQEPKASSSSPPSMSKSPTSNSVEPPKDIVPDSFRPWLLVSRKKPNPKKKPATLGMSLQPPTQAIFSPTRHNPILQQVPIPNKVNEIDPSTNKGKRKLVTSTNLILKHTNKPKPKAQSPLKHSKAYSPTKNGNQPKSQSSSQKFWPNQTSTSILNTLAISSCPFEQPPFSFLTQTKAASTPPLPNHHALGNMAQEQAR